MRLLGGSAEAGGVPCWEPAGARGTERGRVMDVSREAAWWARQVCRNRTVFFPSLP